MSDEPPARRRRASGGGSSSGSAAEPVPPAPRGSDPADAPAAPILPDRASEDRDEAWGDRSGDDDERILRERPPHW